MALGILIAAFHAVSPSCAVKITGNRDWRFTDGDTYCSAIILKCINHVIQENLPIGGEQFLQ